jgi:predicted CxxxxCH...CXXCH cytochrome family protein
MSLVWSAMTVGGCAQIIGIEDLPDDLGQEPPPAPPPPPNTDPLLGCNGQCHGDKYNTAPPRDVAQGVETSRRGVGAHRQHLDPSPTFHRRVECEDCHTVPGEIEDTGHIDGTPGAELTFTSIASADGVQPSWNGTTCTVYCHGASLGGGALSTPTWTVVDDSQDRCGNCHGLPPPAPHPPGTDCGTCHPTIQPGSRDFLDPDSHINGTVEVAEVDAEACDACHGSGGIAAPPKDLAGNSDRAMPGVGAHREHLGRSDWHREFSCAQCHTVPTSVDSSGHIDGDNVAEVRFDSLNPTARYDGGSATCTSLYCHGNGSVRLGTVVWTEDLVLDCNSCHDGGTGDSGQGVLSGEHRTHAEQNIGCFECHDAVVNQAFGFVDPDLHINGVFDVRIPSGGEFDAARRGCVTLACHGNESW